MVRSPWSGRESEFPRPTGVQGNQAAMVDDRPIWVRDQRGGGVLPGGDVGGDSQVSESFSVRFHHRDHRGC
jgi:hypothetical protein